MTDPSSALSFEGSENDRSERFPIDLSPICDGVAELGNDSILIGLESLMPEAIDVNQSGAQLFKCFGVLILSGARFAGNPYDDRLHSSPQFDPTLIETFKGMLNVTAPSIAS